MLLQAEHRHDTKLKMGRSGGDSGDRRPDFYIETGLPRTQDCMMANGNPTKSCMMKVLSFSLVPFLLPLCTPIYGECDQCQFTSNDAEDCKVYGAIDDRLIAWNKASSDCLDLYNIVIDSIDPSLVGCDSPRNVNFFVNGIKFETIPNSVRGGLGESEGGFFEQQNGVYVLNNTITIDGTTID